MKKIFIYFLLSFLTFVTQAQSVTITGYIKDMEGVYLFDKPLPPPSGDIKAINYNLIHNRLNFRAYAGNSITLALELRNRVFSGKLLEQIPDYADVIAKDDGLIDLSWNIIENDKWFFNTSIDRIFIDYTIGDWQLRAGRQRINWGINLVWNPNDIFNAFSYMDFDYEERPGSDAILGTWYPSMSSSVDIAYKAADTIYNRAIAAKYRFNWKNYDIQFIAGQTGYDYIIGGGWSGNISNFGFRGETSYFIPLEKYNAISEEGISASISLDYSFENSLFIHTSFLFNSLGTTDKGQSFSLIDPSIQLSAKQLSIGKYELFGQLSYPIGSLFNAGIASMLNPIDLSMFVAPSISISLQDNIEFYLTSQIMMGDEGTEYAAIGNLYAIFGRIRWSF